MKDHHELYEACSLHFGSINKQIESLEAMLTKRTGEIREDFKELEKRVMNGLTDRIAHLESQVTKLDTDRDVKSRRIARWETAIISAVVGLAFTAAIWMTRHYFEVNHPSSQTQQSQPSKTTP